MTAASSPVRTAPVNAPARSSTRAFTAAPVDDTNHEGLDLADIPRLDTNLDIEGLKPTLLSRLFDLFGPKR